MGGGHEAAEGRRRLDAGVVCVCFAMLGVPLGSGSLMGRWRGVGGSGTCSGGSIITLPPWMVFMCVNL